MEKFVLVTRGRTGATAVLDELGKAGSLLATQELFLRYSFTKEMLRDLYKLLLPFDLWKQRGWWWEKMFPDYYSDPRQAHRYLMRAENLAQRRGIKGFGWKVLSHQFDERPFLSELLLQHGYKVIYLKRNSVRQVLSGMVANQRGIYNSLEKVVDDRRYPINIGDFKWHVAFERDCVKNDCVRLRAAGFDFVVVSYEDYCANREAFYVAIFKLLKLPVELPPASDFVRVIEDLRAVIENYDEVASAAAEMGEEL